MIGQRLWHPSWQRDSFLLVHYEDHYIVRGTIFTEDGRVIQDHMDYKERFIPWNERALYRMKEKGWRIIEGG